MKKGFLIITAFLVWMMVVITSCAKEEVVPVTSEPTTKDPGDEIVDGWPSGMVHLNELDSVK